MKSKILLIVAIIFSVAAIGQEKFDKKEVFGSWMGKLKGEGFELRIVFNISVNNEGSLLATMDSPDQNAKGIPMGAVSFDGVKLTINAPDINGVYEGKMTEKTVMKGKWSQNGHTLDLNLAKKKKDN